MKYIKLMTLALLAMGLGACEDFLEPEPISSIGGATFFSNEDELTTGVINMYDGIKGLNSTTVADNNSIQTEFYLTEMRSDNTRSKSQEGEAAQFESWTVESTNGIVSDYYASYYNVIFRANTVLANLDASSEANRNAFEAEAKFVRGYAYFNLVRLFGDIPLVETVITPADLDAQFTRVATSTVYELIVSDLEMAVEYLDNSSKYRGSQAAAQALLAKVHLTLGNYDTARELLEAIIDSGEFSLEDNFVDVFYSEGNDEIIWAIGYLPDDTNNSQLFSSEWLNAVGRTSGVNYVTADMRTAFGLYGGNRSDYSFRQDAIQPLQYQVVKYLPNGDDDLGIAATSSDPTLAGNDWIVLRYADVLLMHVESIIGDADNTTSNDAIASFQAVRDRAGLTTAVTAVSKDDLLTERRVELAFENHRFFDLVRFGEAQSVLSTFADANGYTFTASDLLLPIPSREIGLSNGLLSQNPGY